MELGRDSDTGGQVIIGFGWFLFVAGIVVL